MRTVKERGKAEVRELNGYRCLLRPDHPRCMKGNWSGYVYEHIMIAEEFLKRPLRRGEVVHHLDQNRSNNRAENLLVLENSQHGRLHAWLKGVAMARAIDENRVNSANPKTCETCQRTLQGKQLRFCSKLCMPAKLQWLSMEQLAGEMTRLSLTAIGRKHGVSDNAIRKCAIRYGLSWQRRAKPLLEEGVETTGVPARAPDALT